MQAIAEVNQGTKNAIQHKSVDLRIKQIDGSIQKN